MVLALLLLLLGIAITSETNRKNNGRSQHHFKYSPTTREPNSSYKQKQQVKSPRSSSFLYFGTVLFAYKYHKFVTCSRLHQSVEMIPMHSKQEFDRRHSDPREAAMVMYGSQRLHYPVSNYPMWQYNPGRYVPQTMMMSMSMPAFAQQQQEALMAMSVGRSSLSSPHRPFMSTISKVPNSPASPPVLSPPQAAVASTNAAPASGVDKQRDIEAAEVLLGLTSKDGGDEKEASNAQKEQAPSMHKSAAASVGHVTDTESSTGTLSRTNSPLLNHHRRNHETSSTSSVPTVDASGTWYNGSVSLSLPEDDDVLSPLHCFMRKYCVEAFSATAQDVATPRYGKSHGFKVEVGQVGIRKCFACHFVLY
jgi:hypothetical protein